MLVSATEMINKAHEGHYAIGAFNINNLEWTKAILAAAEEAKSPVMLGVSEGAAKYMCGFKTVAAMVKEIHDAMGITVPVALHLDHGSYEGAKAAIEAGFTSVMFDGSHYAFEENLEKSKEEYENSSENVLEEAENLEKQLQEIEISYATEKQRVESIDENIQIIRDRINKQKDEISKSEESKKELLNSKELDEQEMAKISKENEEKQAIIDEFASSNKDSQTYIDNLNMDITFEEAFKNICIII